MIVVFPDHTHLLFFLTEPNISEGPDYEKYQHYIELQGEVLAHMWRETLIFLGGQHFEIGHCLFCDFYRKMNILWV